MSSMLYGVRATLLGEVGLRLLSGPVPADHGTVVIEGERYTIRDVRPGEVVTTTRGIATVEPK